jgi:hypothetical protein
VANGSGEEDVRLHHASQANPAEGLIRMQECENQPAEHRQNQNARGKPNGAIPANGLVPAQLMKDRFFPGVRFDFRTQGRAPDANRR